MEALLGDKAGILASCVLLGAAVYVWVYLVRRILIALRPSAKDAAWFPVFLKALAVASGVLLALLGKSSLFATVDTFKSALLGGLSGFLARDAWDIFKAVFGSGTKKLAAQADTPAAPAKE